MQSSTSTAPTLESLAQQALQSGTLSAADSRRIYQALHRPLSQQERRLLSLLRDAIANQHIQVTSL